MLYALGVGGAGKDGAHDESSESQREAAVDGEHCHAEA